MHRKSTFVNVLLYTLACAIFAWNTTAYAYDVPKSTNLAPHIEQYEGKPYLFVDGELFLVKSMEIRVDKYFEFTDYRDSKPLFKWAKDDGFNTAKVEFAWSMLEQTEGDFDFTILDWIFDQCVANGLKLHLSWFGSLLNGVSFKAPHWLQNDEIYHFWRLEDGSLPAPSELNGLLYYPLCFVDPDLQAKEKLAIEKTIEHLRMRDEADGFPTTLIMVQIENEMMIGLPSHRCFCEDSNRFYNESPFKDDLDFTIWSFITVLDEYAKVVEDTYGADIPTTVNGDWHKFVHIWFDSVEHIDIFGPDQYGFDPSNDFFSYTPEFPFFMMEMGRYVAAFNLVDAYMKSFAGGGIGASYYEASETLNWLNGQFSFYPYSAFDGTKASFAPEIVTRFALFHNWMVGHPYAAFNPTYSSPYDKTLQVDDVSVNLTASSPISVLIVKIKEGEFYIVAEPVGQLTFWGINSDGAKLEQGYYDENKNWHPQQFLDVSRFVSTNPDTQIDLAQLFGGNVVVAPMRATLQEATTRGSRYGFLRSELPADAPSIARRFRAFRPNRALNPVRGFRLYNLPSYTGELTSPPPISSAAAYFSSGGIKLTWDEIQADNISGYNIYRSRTPSFVPQEANLVDFVRENRYLDRFIENEKRYYRVVAVDSPGNLGIASPELYPTSFPPDSEKISKGGAEIWSDADWADCIADGVDLFRDEGRRDSDVRLAFFESVPEVSFTPDANTIGLWHLEGGKGLETFDSSGNQLTGKLNGEFWATDSKVESHALIFNGNNNVRIENQPLLNGMEQLTLESWVKPMVLNGKYQVLVRKDHTYTLDIDTGNHFRFLISHTRNVWVACNSDYEIRPNRWYHVAGVYNGEDIRLYINGVERGVRVSTKGPLNTNGNVLTMGYNSAEEGWQTNWYTGLLDEVRLNNVARYTEDFAMPVYVESGTLFGSVEQFSFQDMEMTNISWVADTPPGTSIDVFVRGGNVSFSATDVEPAWVRVTNGQDTGLPIGQKLQWKAVLATTKPKATPVLREISFDAQSPPWDVDKDGIVDIIDLVLVGTHFGERITTPPEKNPDVNGDGIVDIFDLVLVGAHFGRKLKSPAGAPSSGALVWSPYEYYKGQGQSHRVAATVRARESTPPNQVWIDVISDAVDEIHGFQFDLEFDPNLFSALNPNITTTQIRSGYPVWSPHGVGEALRADTQGWAATRDCRYGPSVESGSAFWTVQFIQKAGRRGAPSVATLAGTRIGTASNKRHTNVLTTLTFGIRDVKMKGSFTSSFHSEHILKINNVKLVTRDGKVVLVQAGDSLLDLESILVPNRTAVAQNYPNPFNPETWIPYQLAKDASVKINIYNVAGQLVNTLNIGRNPAGIYSSKQRAAHWDGTNETGEKVASGVYFFSIQAGNFMATKKMVVLK